MGKPTTGAVSIRAWLLIVFGLVVLGLSIGVPLVTSHQEDRAIRKFANAESERTAEMVFDHLYSVMRKGWSREDIDEILGRINSRGDAVQVRLYRGPQLAEEYGAHPPSVAALASDPDIRTVFDDGADKLITMGGDIRYLYPLANTAECMDCHHTGALGDINGVIEVRFATAEMRVPLRTTLRSAEWLYGAGAVLLFLTLLAVLQGLIVRPIIRLSGTMRSILDSDDLSRRVTLRRLWPREVQSVAQDFNRLMAEVERDREVLLNLTERDPLTGAFNRRRFDAAIDGEAERSRRTKRPASVLLIDLDRFKPINDTYGHAAGDVVLKGVASILQARTRQVDLVARVGGDEFAVLAPETNTAQATTLAAALTTAIESLDLFFDGHPLPIGASIGIGTMDMNTEETPADILARADADMYRVKQERRAERV